MPIRVTQHMMYYNMVHRMQNSLGAYMESNEQGSSQKKINKPSDDPIGMYRVLTTRNAISSTEQYEKNSKTALGWLQQADDTLSTHVTSAIIQLKQLAEQAATGTYDATNREQMAFLARELFGELLNLANMEVDGGGRHLFGGHIYDRPAYEEGLAVTCWDDEWQSATDINGTVQRPPAYDIKGSSDTTLMIRFTSDGEIGQNQLDYQWSKDGGKTWVDETLPIGSSELVANGVRITVPPKDATTVPATGLTVKAADPDIGPGANNGTLLYIRPTAIYMGDDNDPPPDITFMGGQQGLQGAASGTFHNDVVVRVNSVPPNPATPNVYPTIVDFSVAGTPFTYSYSTDGGSNWITVTGATTGNTDANGNYPVRLTIPGGYLDVTIPSADTQMPNGTQVRIHPDRADLDFEIMKDTFITVNNVGKDIFGGYYQGAPVMYNDNNGTLSNDRALSSNLFEVVGNFIAYLENNNQEGCQRTLPALLEAEKVILTAAAKIGGKENRVETAQNVLSFQKIDQKEQLSYTEDIDLTELLAKLTQQQLTYSTVLKSSSMIMQLSLVNYV